MSEYTIPGMHVRDRFFPVPLDWARADGGSIEIFVREVVDPSRRNEDLPILCFLQGGPGGKSPRPMREGPVWLHEALKTHRVLLPDQRGTGRSSPVTAATMARFADGAAGADFLALFRADAIVADFDHIRRRHYGGGRWSTLGQSYGGFLTLTWLSRAPEGLAACYVTGGLPWIGAAADDVYRLTYPRVAGKNAAYFRRYPQDAARLSAIADRLEAEDVRLPDGDRLTFRRLQTLGLDLGMGPGAERIHWLLDEAFEGNGGRLSDHFLAQVMVQTAFHSNPLFAAIHEAIYGQGQGATDWSAQRLRAEFPAFDPGARPPLFTGEMIYPWMFEDIASLRPFRAAAEALAARPVWPALYDPARLAANEVPVAAAIWHDDMFVDEGLSRRTAAATGNLDYWITNAYEHDGLHQSAGVFGRLRDMVLHRGGPLA
ncbi:MAG: alpha/beta fold hydrolase [Rhodobacteraceae bacterium]|jgi:pimeloyl-ACP methyl ester carboxylesterase|nr:alpha/beta fold hydrolase [Paracoccaceae bacterium]